MASAEGRSWKRRRASAPASRAIAEAARSRCSRSMLEATPRSTRTCRNKVSGACGFGTFIPLSDARCQLLAQWRRGAAGGPQRGRCNEVKRVKPRCTGPKERTCRPAERTGESGRPGADWGPAPAARYRENMGGNTGESGLGTRVMPADRAREDGADWKAPPRDFERFRELLLDRRDGLPSRLLRAAEYALAHPDEIAFGTVASVAEAAEIQPSALIRFAKALGYNGFSELQEVFRHRLRERWPPYGERLAKLRTEAPEGGPAGLLRRFSASAALSLAKLDDTAGAEDLERAVAVLASAGTIHLLGLRRA